jgi:uncharacterized membrane protein YdbT with pleckstrin-like domain
MKEFELEPGEFVVKIARKHWFIFLLELLPFAILALIPLALPSLIVLAGSAFATYTDYIDLSSTTVRIVLSVWWLLLWCGAFKRFTDYYLDAWVITNQRIVDINQKGFFHRSVSSLLLNRVQDVTVSAQGILVSLLNIGDINVQTAGTIERFSMCGVPHPSKLRDIIIKYVPENDSKPV